MKRPLPLITHSGASPLHAHILGTLAARIYEYVLTVWQRGQQRRSRIRALFILLCVACTFALGQGQGEPNPSKSPISSVVLKTPLEINDVVTAIGTTVGQSLDALKNNSRLHDFGTGVTAFLLLALLVWTSVKTMAGGRGIADLLGEWVPVFVSLGVVTLFLDRSAGELIVKTMDGIAMAIGGDDMSTLDAAISAGAKPIFRAMSSVISQPRVVSELKDGVHWYQEGWAAAVAANAASFFMGIIAKLAAGFCLLVAGVGMVSNIIMSYMSVRLVIALAPVMVPFLMFKPMEWLFNSWLKFLMGACMLKIVLAFLINVVVALLGGMDQLAQRLTNDVKKLTPLQALQVDILMLGMMMVFALLATVLIAQAPKIAEGLLAGGASGAGFSGVKAVTESAGAKFVDKAARAGAAGLLSLAKRAKRAGDDPPPPPPGGGGAVPRARPRS